MKIKMPQVPIREVLLCSDLTLSVRAGTVSLTRTIRVITAQPVPHYTLQNLIPSAPSSNTCKFRGWTVIKGRITVVPGGYS